MYPAFREKLSRYLATFHYEVVPSRFANRAYGYAWIIANKRPHPLACFIKAKHV
jgi:hypothetical protein